MKQYFELKAKHKDALLLFRVGDFYETFGEDAIKASKVLGITLTSRNNGGSDIALAGFPYHSVDVYLPKLVRGGQKRTTISVPYTSKVRVEQHLHISIFLLVTSQSTKEASSKSSS